MGILSIIIICYLFFRNWSLRDEIYKINREKNEELADAYNLSAHFITTRDWVVQERYFLKDDTNIVYILLGDNKGFCFNISIRNSHEQFEYFSNLEKYQSVRIDYYKRFGHRELDDFLLLEEIDGKKI